MNNNNNGEPFRNNMPTRRNSIGISICIRDDQGSFVLAKNEWFSPILDVNTGEAIDLLHALKWVQELQLENVDFELDSKNVVAKFHSKARDIFGSRGSMLFFAGIDFIRVGKSG
ncbi:cytochrome p450, partial [Trifolium pratense]